MTVIRKEQKERLKNVLLRVSIPAQLMSELKKTQKLCRENKLYFDVKPDIIAAVEKAIEEALVIVSEEKKRQSEKNA
ncbi:MAG: hypothetical protein KBA28_14035 [Syntrophaceae bacterium]|jgi:hypothetical protein|nr:hypothetical protein [Syntrophaceae bacterium]HOC59220.1 hypothetical protein [Smithellaceae bacterium]HQM44255.1 hypothetical protein [Smithellaceae bacterium]